MANGQEKKEQQEQRGTLLTFINPTTGTGTVKSNFTKIPNSIIFDKGVKSQDKELYNILLGLPYRKRRGASDVIHVTHEYLCEVTGASRRTILYSLDRLEKAGYCKRVKINGKLSELQVIIKPSATEKLEQEINEMISDVLA